MVNDAARILKTAARKGKAMMGYQGLRLATVLSVEPFKLSIDGIECDFLADDVVINAQLVPYTYHAAVKSSESVLSGKMDVSGSASLGTESGTLSLSGGSAVFSGNLNTENTEIAVQWLLADGDRVAVADVGMNKYLILCKVVSL